MKGALVGLTILKLNLSISGRNAVFLVEQNPGQPALFTLPGTYIVYGYANMVALLNCVFFQSILIP